MLYHKIARKYTYRSLILSALILGGSSLVALPIFAASPTPGDKIENQATGSFVDESDDSIKSLISEKVTLTIGEVAGITVTTNGVTGIASQGATVYYSFKITNVGNDPTQFFIPDLANITSGNATQSGNVEITSYNLDGTTATSTSVIVPSGGKQTGSNGTVAGLLGTGSAGVFLPGGSVTVKVPVLINANATGTVDVQLGDTPVDPLSSATPQARLENQAYIAGSRDVYTVDNPDSLDPTLSAGMPINGDTINHRQEAAAVKSTTVTMPGALTVSGNVFHDQDANVAINGTDAGTNAGSSTLTVYAVDPSGKVTDKSTVAANGTYSLSNVPASSTVKLRLSNDDTVAVGGTAPATSLPTQWFNTGENLNGTIDPVIATLGDIALTTTTVNLTNENFGIRQATVIAADPAPTVCTVDYRTSLNTGISASGGKLAVGSNDLNWTAEWIAGPPGTANSPIGTPYAPPRPVGPMPAVVVGNLAPGAWLTEPSNASWISYPFRLSTNSNGNHINADLDNKSAEDGSSVSIVGTSDAVRLKFSSSVTLPANANLSTLSVPIGAAMDNQFTSIKVNGVENLSPVPAPNSQAANFGTRKNVNLTQGWQPGVNVIEVVMDSGPPEAGFFLDMTVATVQTCSAKPNVLLVKRITAINGVPVNTYNDDTISTNPLNDNDTHWPSPLNTDSALGDTSISTYLKGAINGGIVKPGDEIEYTIYFLNAGGNANTVRICDLLTPHQNYRAGSMQLQLGASSSASLTDIQDSTDRGEFVIPTNALPTNCNLSTTSTNSNGVVVIDITGTNSPVLPQLLESTAPGTPNDSYGFIRFKANFVP